MDFCWMQRYVLKNTRNRPSRKKGSSVVLCIGSPLKGHYFEKVVGTRMAAELNCENGLSYIFEFV